MRISGTGSLPRHIASAYGVANRQGAAAANQPSASATPSRVARPDGYRPAGSAERLVAATVKQPVEFAETTQAYSNAAGAGRALQLYTRAADRVEAAVRIELGRSIDVRG